jgi:ATP-dependent RNA helicase RhlB
MSETHLSKTEYSSLSLNKDLQKGIQEAGFKFCTPIQALTLPLALEGKDISGQAQTGTGKTAAFLIAAFELLHKKIAYKTRKQRKRNG